MKIDTKWFDDLIRASPYRSRRQLSMRMKNARGTKMDPSSLTKMLQGERSMATSEAKQLSDLLGVSLSEILRHAGVQVEERKTKPIPVIGEMDEFGGVTIFPRKDWGKKTVQAPVDCPVGTVVIHGFKKPPARSR